LEQLPNVNFIEKFENGYGRIIILGLNNLPGNFLPELWSKFRKHYLRKEFCVDAAATFIVKKDFIDCYAFCNSAYAEHHEIPAKIYTNRFCQTFQYWANDFENLLETISADADFCQRDNETDISYSERLLKIAFNYLPILGNTTVKAAYEKAANKQDAKLA